MANKRWVVAVISDLHAYAKLPENHQRPSHLSISTGEQQPENHPIAGLLDVIKKNGISANVLLCPGDLGHQACPESVRYGWATLKQIREALKAKHLIGTAGNHDLDSRYLHGNPDAAQTLKNLVPQFPCDKQILADQYWARDYTILEVPPAAIVILNSSAHHGKAENEKNHGRITKDVLSSLRTAMPALARFPKEWHLSDTVPSFLAVRHALSARLSTIKELVARELMLGVNGRDARLLDAGFLFLDFVQGCTNAIELFDDTLSKGETRWALMFDELELAPEWISNLLVRAIRSTDERLLFKLALNPFTNTSTQLESPTSPAPGQDFDQIALWYAEKRDSYEFCSQLFAQLLENRGLVLKEPRKILGNSYFETTDEEWRDLGNAYAPGSKIATRFKRLYEIDQSFRDYLDRRGLHPDRLHQLSPNQRASDVRKIAPIVAVREFFRSADWRRDARTRSRKLRASLYAGAESIFAISEGNPRWFIAIVEDLLDEWGSKRDRIPEHVQADELQKAAERFAAMLKTIPTESQTTESVFRIVKSVARYFNRHVVKEDFRPEPPGTFRVDDQCSDEIVSILGQALNAGGIVCVPDEDGQLSFTSLRHKRFRVSYLIAPLYGIPIRLGPVVNLSTILGSKRAAPSLPGLLPFPRSSGEEEADV